MKTYTTEEKWNMYLSWEKPKKGVLPRKTNIMLLETGFHLSVERKEAYYKKPHPKQCIKYGDYVPEITEQEFTDYFNK